MSQVNERLRGQVSRYMSLSRRQPWGLLLLYVGLTAASLLIAKTSLRIETSFEPLLPQGTGSVAALNESRARSGSADLYTIAVTSPDPAANVRMIKALSAKMDGWEETLWTQVDRDPSFFSDHALLYLPEADLQKLKERLEGEVTLEKKRNNPLFVDLRTPEEREAEDAERWKLEGWLDPNLPERLGLERELFDQILAADKLGLPAEGAAPAGEAAAAPAAESKPRLPKELEHYLINEAGDVAVVLASLTAPPTDLVKSQELLERGEALIEALDPKTFHPEMSAEVVGAYRTFEEARSISNDSTTATITSVVLVLLVLLVFFRNGRSLLLLLVPLLMGVSWSVGLTTLTFGHLNVTTLFVFSMLVGMGIDFGIHLYARVLEEFHGGRSLEESLTEATVTTGRSMVSAALTTVVALLTLLVASFQGFVEFGLIAGYGIALCLLATLLVLPPSAFALDRVLALKRREGEAREAGVLPETPVRTRRVMRVAALSLMVVGLAGCVLAGLHWDEASFEHDFRRLRTENSKSGLKYGGAVGRGKSTTPAMILGRDPEQMREVHVHLAALAQQNREALAREQEAQAKGDEAGVAAARKDRTYIRNFVTLETFVPPSQEARMKIIDEIHGLVTDKKLSRSQGKARSFLDRMKALSEVKPFTIAEVPDWARRSIREKDGVEGAIGFIYADIQKWDMLEVQDFQDKVGLMRVREGVEVPVASSQFILSDVIRTVKSDALTLTPVVFVVLFLILLLDLRSLKGALVCLLTMGVALLWTVGGMVLFDIRLGLYNMVLLPMVLGTGIDGAIHLYHRYKELGPRRVGHVFSNTGASVAASSITTLVGFVGLLFVEHLGIQSIGYLAVVGISATLLAVFAFMPGLLTLVYGRGDDLKDAQSGEG
jgi:predicted RND superfamily exporter protein